MTKLNNSLILVMQILPRIWAYKILGYFPIPSYSHSEVQNKLMLELYKRGHDITLISAFPSAELQNNCRTIDLSPVYEKWEDATDMTAWERATPTEVIFSWNNVVEAMCEGHVNLPEFQEFIRSGRKFDMIITEQSVCVISTLVFVSGNPTVVELVPYEPFSFHFQAVGNPFPPSYSAVNMLPYSDHMTFYQRLINFYTHLTIQYFYNIIWLSIESRFQERFSKSKFPIEHPTVSLLITNDHWSVTYPVGLLPSVLEVRGFLIDPHEQPPSQEISTFMDEATEGLIYLSMGTNVNSSAIPKDKVNAFLETFLSLPCHVIWKWDLDPLPELPTNVMQVRWAPQQAVLAHPNARLFITQGGMQSLQQAINYEVPLVVIPFLTEQKFNGRKVQHSGTGEVLGFRNLTTDTLLDTITMIFNNYERYKNNLAQSSSIFRDDPAPPLERTIWWLEYYLRHKGATHLQSSTLDLHWTQYLMLDVLALAVLTMAALFFIISQMFSQAKELLRRKSELLKFKK